MNMFCLQGGVNYIDNAYGHISGVNCGKIIAVEGYSQSAGTVTITQKARGFDKESSVAEITIGSDGYGIATGVNRYFAYGDTLTVTGDPVGGGNSYSVRVYFE